MTQPQTPSGEAAGFEIDARLRRTFLRIVLIEVSTVGFLSWISRVFLMRAIRLGLCACFFCAVLLLLGLGIVRGASARFSSPPTTS